MENENISIVIRLKELRKENKLSQEDLAEALGLSRQSIISIEQGKSIPSLPVAFSICKFFQSSFEDLFNFGNEINKQIEDTINNEENSNIKILNNPEESGRKESNMSELNPWRPLREVTTLREAMDQLFQDSVITPKTSAVMPRIDIKDKKDKIVVKAELPGMVEDDIDIEIADGVMTISGEKKEESEKEDEGYYYKESHTGVFSRSFNLPADVVESKADAEMKNGVLSITIPKTEPKKATKIKIASKK